MTIKRIDKGLCNGCGICVNSCPTDVIRLDRQSKKAVIKYPEDCMLCEWCKTDCPQHAISISPDKVSPLLTSWG
jgi:NAD-dependent dihydropyrimidine dehydrogenase PreA subunit